MLFVELTFILILTCKNMTMPTRMDRPPDLEDQARSKTKKKTLRTRQPDTLSEAHCLNDPMALMLSMGTKTEKNTRANFY